MGVAVAAGAVSTGTVAGAAADAAAGPLAGADRSVLCHGLDVGQQADPSNGYHGGHQCYFH